MKSAKKRVNTPVSGVLPEVVRHKGWQLKLDQHSFFPIWAKVVGADIATCSRPLKVVKNVLWLEVENSTWMQQLQFEKVRILENINATLKISKIQDVKFTLPGSDQQKPPEERAEISFVSPDPEDLQRFEQQVSCIEDDAIRDALVRLWYLSKACKPGEKS